MKISEGFFYVFAILFFAFAVAFINFSNYSMTQAEGGSRFWLMRITLLLDVVCITLLISCIKRKYRGIHIVCMLWLLVMPVIMMLNHADLADMVRTILWPLLFETTYLCCQNRLQRCSFFKKEYYILAFIGGFYFLATRIGASHQSNTIYLCFLTLPWLMFLSNKKTMLTVVFIFTILALLSMKRSVMLAMVLMWGFYFLYGMKSKRSKLFTIVLSLVLLVGLYVVYDKVDDMSGGLLTERVNKEETDTGKSREAIWTITISMIQQSSPVELAKGHGHYGVRRDSWLEISAHNDFLEVIYDYGLIILVLYLCLWVYVIRRGYKLYKSRSLLFLPYAATLSIFIVLSMVSHLILYTTYFNYLVMFWGMTEAILEMDRKQEFISKRITR